MWSSGLLRQVAASGPTGRPLVALTIDDGWFSRDAVIRVLEAKDVQLTLFLAGRPIVGDYGFIARALQRWLRNRQPHHGPLQPHR